MLRLSITFALNRMFLLSYGGTGGQKVFQYTVPTSLTLGTGSFASTDLGKTINVNDGALVLTATDGSYVETTAPTSFETAASGEWSMFGVVYDAADDVLELSNNLDVYNIADASYSSVSFSVNAQESSPTGLAFNTDGTKMFICGYVGDDVTNIRFQLALIFLRPVILKIFL